MSTLDSLIVHNWKTAASKVDFHGQGKGKQHTQTQQLVADQRFSSYQDETETLINAFVASKNDMYLCFPFQTT